ncbi:hypothetical protein JCM3765_007562 [Sporobolomyces pararoseus]
MVKPMHEQSPSVKLLTILNVQSAKPPPSSTSSTKKRSSSSTTIQEEEQKEKVKKQVVTRDWHGIAKRANKTTTEGKGKGNKKLKLDSTLTDTATTAPVATQQEEDKQPLDEEEEEEVEKEDSFKSHFGSNTTLLDKVDKESLEKEQEEGSSSIEWDKKKKLSLKGFGEFQVFTPKNLLLGEAEEQEEKKIGGLDLYATKLLNKLESNQNHSNWLSLLSSYRDISYSNLSLFGSNHSELIESTSLHCMNHVLKTRSRILKNNEYFSKISSNPSLTQPTKITTDQGFTRPKVLILTPFRSKALEWVSNLVNYSLVSQIENYERFLSEYSLPEGVVDKLVERKEDYPLDHVETFKGNIDDSFRVGLKVNRKQVKVFAEFYQADLIVASPLGLRTSIEKEDDSDFLSSIEIVVVDQMDVMLMQNWEHLNFVIERLNKIPQEDHGCDFSRVKPWYLDGKSKFLRQSILLSRFQTPETLNLFNKHLNNQQGKLKSLQHFQGSVIEQVPRGLKQVWNRFECLNSKDLDDKRFEWFTEKTLPSLMKSAISSSQTIIFVPSYFDFIRLKRYLSKNLQDFSFSSISEYTPTPEVSRSRGSFFSGKTKFLLVTERFHFFRRYRLRGAKTVVFYAPPQHPDYYSEFLSFPFTSTSSLGPGRPLVLDPEVQVDESELSAHVVFSKFDLLKLERIVGTKDARRMCGIGNNGNEGKNGETRFTFV